MKRTYQPSRLVKKEDMGSGPECLQKAVESLFPEDQKEEKNFYLKW